MLNISSEEVSVLISLQNMILYVCIFSLFDSSTGLHFFADYIAVLIEISN